MSFQVKNYFKRAKPPALTKVTAAGSEKFACRSDDCGKEFDSARHLLRHQLEVNHLDLVCHVCEKAFTLKSSVRRHIKSVHVQEQYVCPHCPEVRSFNDASNLRRHVKNAHNGYITNAADYLYS